MELEGQLKAALGQMDSNTDTGLADDSFNNSPFRAEKSNMDIESPTSGLLLAQQGGNLGFHPSENSTTTATESNQGASVPWLSDGHLATEFESLSLKAMAEKPFLGSSSGVSFARLTQAVLRRLQPDQYSFSSGQQPPQTVTSTRNLWEAQMMPPAHRLPPSEIPDAPLPSMEQASYLEEFYWSHSHTLYPFLQKAAFKKVLSEVYADPARLQQLPASASYRVWMVFAIGSTTLAAMGMGNGSQSVAYFNKAMNYFERALMEGSVVWTALHPNRPNRGRTTDPADMLSRHRLPSRL
jgi:hypothetical protein